MSTSVQPEPFDPDKALQAVRGGGTGAPAAASDTTSFDPDAALAAVRGQGVAGAPSSPFQAHVQNMGHGVLSWPASTVGTPAALGRLIPESTPIVGGAVPALQQIGKALQPATDALQGWADRTAPPATDEQMGMQGHPVLANAARQVEDFGGNLAAGAAVGGATGLLKNAVKSGTPGVISDQLGEAAGKAGPLYDAALQQPVTHPDAIALMNSDTPEFANARTAANASVALRAKGGPDPALVAKIAGDNPNWSPTDARNAARDPDIASAYGRGVLGGGGGETTSGLSPLTDAAGVQTGGTAAVRAQLAKRLGVEVDDPMVDRIMGSSPELAARTMAAPSGPAQPTTVEQWDLFRKNAWDQINKLQKQAAANPDITRGIKSRVDDLKSQLMDASDKVDAEVPDYAAARAAYTNKMDLGRVSTALAAKSGDLSSKVAPLLKAGAVGAIAPHYGAYRLVTAVADMLRDNPEAVATMGPREQILVNAAKKIAREGAARTGMAAGAAAGASSPFQSRSP